MWPFHGLFLYVCRSWPDQVAGGMHYSLCRPWLHYEIGLHVCYLSPHGNYCPCGLAQQHRGPQDSKEQEYFRHECLEVLEGNSLPLHQETLLQQHGKLGSNSKRQVLGYSQKRAPEHANVYPQQLHPKLPGVNLQLPYALPGPGGATDWVLLLTSRQLLTDGLFTSFHFDDL